MYKRYILQELKEWKKRSSRKPLVLRGARQVGKTTLVKEFSKDFKHYISLNLELPRHIKYFNDFEDIDKILEALLFDNGLSITQIKDTLLFIDEIQESAKAIKLLRYFYEDYPDLCVISAGSLLEFTLRRIENFPVGRVEFLYLYPFNFSEYLAAIGRKNVADSLKQIPFNNTHFSSVLELFHRYTIIGGMPEIVKTDIERNSISDLTRIYESITETYKNDMEKYTSNETDRKVIQHIINSAHLVIDQRVKFQNFAGSNYRSREVGEQMRNLEDAKVISLIYPTTNSKLPILPDKKKSPRLQYLDTGLLNYNLKIQSELLKLNDFSSAYKGAIVPHIINQELMSLKYETNETLSFWVREKRQSSAEVDLVIKVEGYIIPIEIKSGSSGKLRSLHQFMDICDHHFAIRMYAGKLEIQKAKTADGVSYYLLNLPYFLASEVYNYAHWFINHPKYKNKP